MRAESRSWDRLAVAVAPVSATLVLLGALGPGDALTGLVGALVAAAAAVLLRRFLPIYGPFLALLPILAVLAYLLESVPISVASEAVAGLAGLGLLAWIGLSDDDRLRPQGVLTGALVPALGLGVALAVSLLLPVARQSIGVAAALLAGALGLLAWAVLSNSPEPGVAETFPPSL